MQRTPLVLLSFLLAPSLYADAGQHLIPAGSVIGCTLSEPRLSSKNTAVGDPVMCRVGHSLRYGGAVLPYNSYLVGRFEDYKDPGHFVGKGWMELRFDRMVIEPDTVIAIDARVVDVAGYKVDSHGRILGKGHATRDVVLWTIPILWPIDLLMLPMRGPRPALKEETRLSLKVMDDLMVPPTEPYPADSYGLKHRETGENDPPPRPAPNPEPAPETTAYAYAPAQQQPVYPQQLVYPQPVYQYVPVVVAMPPIVYMPMMVAPAPPPAFAYSPMQYIPVPVPYGYAAPAWGYPTAAYNPYGYAPPPAPRPSSYQIAYYGTR
jgi:hypothetical protein